MQAQFSDRSAAWTRAVECLANVDCLLSLLRTKQCLGAPMCRAQFVDDADNVVLDVKELRHPCLVESGFVSLYIYIYIYLIISRYLQLTVP